MVRVYLPTLHWFAMSNPFTGSYGSLRFSVEPKVVKQEGNNKEIDFDQSSITVHYWHGLFCKEKSVMEGQKTFPMSDEGRSAIIEWLEESI